MKIPEGNLSERAPAPHESHHTEWISALAENGLRGATVEEIETALDHIDLGVYVLGSGEVDDAWLVRAVINQILDQRSSAEARKILVVVDEVKFVDGPAIEQFALPGGYHEVTRRRAGRLHQNVPMTPRSKRLLMWQLCPRLRRFPLRDLVADAVKHGREIHNVPVVILNDGRLIAIEVA